MRTILLTLTAAAVVVAPATAAPACNLVPDRSGDAYLVVKETGVPVKTLDIRGVDVASGQKTVVVVMRMSSTKSADEPATALGMTWEVSFKINGVDHRFGRRSSVNGIASDTSLADGKPMPGVKIRTDGNAITWTVPRANLAALRKPGATFTSFFANTASLGGHDYAPDNATVSKARYKDRAPSCLRPA